MADVDERAKAAGLRPSAKRLLGVPGAIVVAILLLPLGLLGLCGVIGSPLELLRQMVKSKEELIRDAAAGELAPLGYQITAGPLAINEPADRNTLIDGLCTDPAGAEHRFSIRFERTPHGRQCTELMIDARPVLLKRPR